MTDIPHNDWSSTSYTIYTGSGHGPRRRREERGGLLVVSTIGDSSDRDGQDFDVFSLDFDFDGERATHGHVESFGPAIHRCVRDAGVGERADVHNESWTIRSCEPGQNGSCQLRGESRVHIDSEVDLFCRALLQRLDFDTTANVVDQDGEIQTVEASHEVINLLTCGRRGIEYSGAEFDILVFFFELGFRSVKLLGVPAMQDDVEAFGGELLGDAKTDAVTSTCYQSPGFVAVEVTLYGGGFGVKVNETKESEGCVGGCCDA